MVSVGECFRLHCFNWEGTTFVFKFGRCHSAASGIGSCCCCCMSGSIVGTIIILESVEVFPNQNQMTLLPRWTKAFRKERWRDSCHPMQNSFQPERY